MNRNQEKKLEMVLCDFCELDDFEKCSLGYHCPAFKVVGKIIFGVETGLNLDLIKKMVEKP